MLADMEYRKGQKVWRHKYGKIEEGVFTGFGRCDISGSGGTTENPNGQYVLANAKFGRDYVSQTCDNHNFCVTKKAAHAMQLDYARREIQRLIKELAEMSALEQSAYSRSL